MMLDDVDIMLRVQAGETNLFAELVSRHQQKLLRFAISKLGNRSDAEDLVQDAFLAAFHARQSYSPSFAFSTWIWTITLNLARRSHRKKLHQETQIVQYQQGNPPRIAEAEAIETLLKEEQSMQLDRWLSLLPEPQADAIRLRFFGNLRFADIAAAMDSSESGAKRRVKNGLTKLGELAAKDE